MVDAGMDEPMHRQIGRGAEGEPYFAEQAQAMNKALRGARSIVFTHEHGDHVTGVIRTPYLAELAPKTILTRTQVNTLETRPQFPDLKITEEQAQRYHVIDYDRYMAFAPGWTLIKAAGHTPGSQMMFITLDSGREYLLIGDAAWHMDGVRKVTGKDAPWIVEDTTAVNEQLKWLNGLSTSERNLVIIASHDDDAAQGAGSEEAARREARIAGPERATASGVEACPNRRRRAGQAVSPARARGLGRSGKKSNRSINSFP